MRPGFTREDRGGSGALTSYLGAGDDIQDLHAIPVYQEEGQVDVRATEVGHRTLEGPVGLDSCQDPFGQLNAAARIVRTKAPLIVPTGGPGVLLVLGLPIEQLHNGLQGPVWVAMGEKSEPLLGDVTVLVGPHTGLLRVPAVLPDLPCHVRTLYHGPPRFTRKAGVFVL